MRIKHYLKTYLSVLALGLFIFLETGCNNEEKVLPDNESIGQEKETTALDISLKSTGSMQSTFESLNIDIQEVSIHISSESDDSTGWFVLETNIGVYDLLDYVSGNDTILAFDPLLEAKTVSQIRLVLGE